MSWFSDLFHPERGYEQAQGKYDLGYQAGQNYLNQGYDRSMESLRPTFERGDQAWEDLHPAFQKLLNPGALQDEWVSGYEPSQYARNQADISREQGANALSSLGLLGSTPGARAVATAGSDIMLRDRQKYLDDLMKKYMVGIEGSTNIYNQGANARNLASQNAMQWGDQSNQNAMKWGDWSATNAVNQYMAPGRLWGSLLGKGSELALGAATNGLYGGGEGDQKKAWDVYGVGGR